MADERLEGFAQQGSAPLLTLAVQDVAGVATEHSRSVRAAVNIPVMAVPGTMRVDTIAKTA